MFHLPVVMPARARASLAVALVAIGAIGGVACTGGSATTSRGESRGESGRATVALTISGGHDTDPIDPSTRDGASASATAPVVFTTGTATNGSISSISIGR